MSNPDVLKVIQNSVKLENDRFWRSKNTFTTEFYNFVTKLWISYSKSEEKYNYFYKFVCNFFLTVMIRSKDKEQTAEFLQMLIAKMTPTLADWLCEMLCVAKVHTELLLDCPSPDSRRFVCTLAQHAIMELIPDSTRMKLLNALLKSLEKSKTSRFFTQFCQVIYFALASL
jgi:hypothetical protein